MCGCHVASSSEEGKDLGFMGTTHALSAVAVFLAFVAFSPDSVLGVLGTSSIAVLGLVAINLVGACLSVDLDNTASTSKSALGFVGDIMSAVYRSISVIVQTTVRSKRDSPEPNPHRGFFHTIPAAILMGLLTYGLTQFNTAVPHLPGLGVTTLGGLFAVLIAWGNTHVAFAGLFRKQMKALKRSNDGVGELIAAVMSLGVVYLLFSQLPAGLDYWWLGVSTTVGMIIHTLGDCFTTAGSPVLFPIPKKGKLWYTVRFTKIKAGGVVENFFFIPAFCVIIALSGARIILSMN